MSALEHEDIFELLFRQVCSLTGLSLTAVYELIGSGQHLVRKQGRRTIVLLEDLKYCLRDFELIGEGDRHV
jgi:hypothetical protein